MGTQKFRFDADGDASIAGLTTTVGITSTGLGTFNLAPAGTGVAQGSVYINPASATASYTLLGVAVGGTAKMIVKSILCFIIKFFKFLKCKITKKIEIIKFFLLFSFFIESSPELMNF